ncbi:hypothetical protein Pcinc_041305 [Petrolisthes cinctipes]|uniref:Uncharacterized protein n=1 Tax=Petrolisthes cinctipes TaxID=88211 RepID=A0AAE1BKF9_PETCI|nr:hypothetical protein Pcinc_041305 [Petrolisthes cinctipes]
MFNLRQHGKPSKPPSCPQEAEFSKMFNPCKEADFSMMNPLHCLGIKFSVPSLVSKYCQGAESFKPPFSTVPSHRQKEKHFPMQDLRQEEKLFPMTDHRQGTELSKTSNYRQGTELSKMVTNQRQGTELSKMVTNQRQNSEAKTFPSGTAEGGLEGAVGGKPMMTREEMLKKLGITSRRERLHELLLENEEEGYTHKLLDSDDEVDPVLLGDRDSDWSKTSCYINGKRYWNFRKISNDDDDDFDFISDDEVKEARGVEEKPYFPDQLLDMINGELSEEQINELAEAMKGIDCSQETEEEEEESKQQKQAAEDDVVHPELNDAQKDLLMDALLDEVDNIPLETGENPGKKLPQSMLLQYAIVRGWNADRE